ncbi:hypothetical protein J2X83_005645 [Brevibacillus nitrificans]|nr:hypothetical protein [Brevibacillus nitrificans]
MRNKWLFTGLSSEKPFFVDRVTPTILKQIHYPLPLILIASRTISSRERYANLYGFRMVP